LMAASCCIPGRTWPWWWPSVLCGGPLYYIADTGAGGRDRAQVPTVTTETGRRAANNEVGVAPRVDRHLPRIQELKRQRDEAAKRYEQRGPGPRANHTWSRDSAFDVALPATRHVVAACVPLPEAPPNPCRSNLAASSAPSVRPPPTCWRCRMPKAAIAGGVPLNSYWIRRTWPR
jgi:hypothetical protein